MKLNFAKALKHGKKFVSNHATTILVAMGISCGVTSTVLAVKATVKAIDRLEEKKEELGVEELNTVEVVKTTWDLYVLSALAGLASAGCIIGANSIHVKRNAALAAAYKLSETALLEYKEAVTETVGEETAKEVENKVVEHSIKKQNYGDSLCYDIQFGRELRCTVDRLDAAFEWLNKNLVKYDFMSLNEFYDYLGIEHIGIGDRLGWNVSMGDIGWKPDSRLIEGIPYLTFEYSKPPVYEYDRF